MFVILIYTIERELDEVVGPFNSQSEAERFNEDFLYDEHVEIKPLTPPADISRSRHKGP